MIKKKTTLIFCLSLFLAFQGKVNAQVDTFKASGSGATGTIQTFTVPTCVSTMTIEAFGAQGGANGGLGAQIQGTFTCTPGEVLNILVGQEGCSNDNSHGSGGGGSFVVKKSNDTILVIAGGGGGHGASGIDATSNGWGSRSGQSGAGSGSPAQNGGGGAAASGATGGNGCVNGSPAGGSTWAGGGGGFCGNGGMYNSNSSYGGYSYMNGGNGGSAATGANCVGGFGGGSGAGDRGGGGGGYSGGAGGTNNGVGGGGGGSYNSGTNQINNAGIRSGNGLVVISYVSDVVSSCVGNVVSSVTCTGGSDGKVSAIVTGGLRSTFTYSWVPGGGTTDTITGLSAGSYTVTVSSACGGSLTASVTLTQPLPLTDTAVATANVFCNGGNDGIVTANTVGGALPLTYLWVPSNETTKAATGLTVGSYTVAITDACGVTASASASITQPAAMNIMASAYSYVSCYGLNNGSVQSSVSGGAMPYTYMWAPGGANTDTMGQLTAGTYTLTVTDNNGCSNSAAVVVTQPNLLTASISPVTEVACNGASTGVIQSTITGGSNPYTYSWSGGKTTANANNVRAGSYTLTVVDSNGCMATATTTVTQPTPLNILQYVTVDSGSCTGSAWVIVSGGVYAYSYLWNNGNSTAYVHYACGGKNYCCVVTDGHGCIDSACVDMLDVAGVASVTGNTSNISIYPNPTSGQFTVSVGSGVGGELKIEVYNLLGEKVYTAPLLNKQGANTEINMNNQAGGVYLYRVLSVSDGHLAGEGKLVLQK